MEDLRRHFAEFTTQLRQRQIATELRGCSAVEILRLEQTLQVSLPLAYRLYLETMGHSAGRLFTHDHLAVSYEFVLELREQIQEGMSDQPKPGTPEFRLPEQALVIGGRLGDQFHYIVCDRPQDSAVFYVNTWDRRPRQAYSGILAWLRDHETVAMEAIRSGYFDKYPSGTTP